MRKPRVKTQLGQAEDDRDFTEGFSAACSKCHHHRSAVQPSVSLRRYPRRYPEFRMRNMRIGLAAIPVLLAGCANIATEPFQLSAPGQHLIGRPEAQVLGCMGTPQQKQVIDPPSVTPNSGKSIWTYEYAEGSQSCSLRLVFKGGYVSEVTSANASGAPLAQPDLCLPPNLAWCASAAPPPPPPPPVKSKLR